MDALAQLFPELGQTELMVHMAVFIGNILLFILARPILKIIDPGAVTEPKVRIFRALNILVFVLQLIGLLLIKADIPHQDYFAKVGYSIMALYGALLFYRFLGGQSKKRFGKQRSLDDKTVYLETYSSRMVSLVLMTVVILTTIYFLILIWNAEDKFTGIYGILAAFMAFTSGIWAPDIISGMIILNTEILEDGDVIMMDGHEEEYVIGRVTLIYVILYDVRNNHRTLMRNHLFMQNRIDNLSRVTSSSGVRWSLLYKIGYPKYTGNRDERLAQLAAFKDSVGDMFTAANQACIENEDIKVNESKPFDWAMTNAGDFALEYTLWIYLERIPNTKITSTIRKHLMGTIFKVNEAVYDASIAEDIDLSTPNLEQVIMSDPIEVSGPKVS